MSIGIPEIMIALTLLAFGCVPLAACVWAVVTLQRIRATQEEMRRRLDGLEQAQQRATTA